MKNIIWLFFVVSFSFLVAQEDVAKLKAELKNLKEENAKLKHLMQQDIPKVFENSSLFLKRYLDIAKKHFPDVSMAHWQKKMNDVECLGKLRVIGQTIALYQMDYGRMRYYPPFGKDFFPSLIKIGLIKKPLSVCPVDNKTYEVREFPIVRVTNQTTKAIVWCKEHAHTKGQRHVLYLDGHSASSDEKTFQKHLEETKKFFAKTGSHEFISKRVKEVYERALKDALEFQKRKNK